MKKLPDYAKSLLLQGASITGNFTEGFYYSEESILINHLKDLLEFCKWIDEHIKGASSKNIDMLFSAYKNPNNVELANQAKELASKIASLRISQ